MRLHLDFECRSRLDLKTVGLDNYSRNAEVLMLGFAFEDDEPEVIETLRYDVHLPPRIVSVLLDPRVEKCAWNCAFERTIFRQVLGIDIPINQWIDPSTIAAYAGIGRSLEAASVFLGLSDAAKEKHRVKENRGVALFSRPNKKGVFPDWNSHPAKWDEFVGYCKKDILAERAVLSRLEGFFGLPPGERRIWEFDQRVNERGIPVDQIYVNQASSYVDEERRALTEELTDLTGCANVNSNAQLLAWLKTQGYPYSSLGAAKVSKALGGVV